MRNIIRLAALLCVLVLLCAGFGGCGEKHQAPLSAVLQGQSFIFDEQANGTGARLYTLRFTEDGCFLNADGGDRHGFRGSGESEDGEVLSYALTLTDGAYTLTANKAALSKGSYTFAPDGVEFSASEGASFTAAYDAARAVVEGTSVPTDAEGLSGVAVTLTKGAQ